ncbi:threonine dehydratase [Fictibacillus macauensis ZFHKF-1]|uniref:L-threonine dehydratase n=1 Tax=Fictibacillus macauensis ZFHKF-1 TaxID=1196324 RepID=I8AFE2_9BACL|nr:threonine ammonia-lyase IlvA [Fictibacillus macauensis]EIT84352.1 threonine dehydratase [Fictibacillus macauensis ZFHKF-1]
MKLEQLKEKVLVEDIMIAGQRIKDVVVHTPLQYNALLSKQYGCKLYLKREDQQIVRSFKIRGAYNCIKKLSKEKLARGVTCASAGNHAQGVAYSCQLLGVNGKIFMPTTTPKQKVNQVEFFGGNQVEIVLTGDTFDDAYAEAMLCCEEEKRTFIHPYDDLDVIAGQGTTAVEFLNDCDEQVDYVFLPIGGGGLAAGVGTYVKSVSPQTKVIGVEPAGAPGMHESRKSGQAVALSTIDPFVDGAAVKNVGKLTYEICQHVIDEIAVIPEGKVCSTLLSLYNRNAIVAEPTGALALAALDQYRDHLKGRTVICVISGGNNDIGRMQEIKERSMIYEGLQHYFIVHFPQRAGALRQFLEEVLGPDDDINRFEYTKKNNKERGPALVGIELKQKEEYRGLMERLSASGFSYQEVNKDRTLFQLLI